MTIAPPPAPILFTPADSATNIARNVALRWYRATLATSYQLQLSIVSDFTTTLRDSAGLLDSLFVPANLLANTTYFWRVNAANEAGTSAYSLTRRFTTGTSTSVSTTDATPYEFRLLQNYPNPFNPSTTIEYQVPNQTHVVLSVYNVLGELLNTIVDREQEAGSYRVTWQPNLPTGIYLYRMQAGDFVQVRKLVLVK
ncbi:MAG: T9SS type A sorting domain-containing protein [Ignavibacteriales bacterium]|nr:T9SS type A sorting domain-containing protein [Ignavibacteriales bacterium]